VIDKGLFLSPTSVRAFLALGSSFVSSSMPSRSSSSSLSRLTVPLLSIPDKEKCDSERWCDGSRRALVPEGHFISSSEGAEPSGLGTFETLLVSKGSCAEATDESESNDEGCFGAFVAATFLSCSAVGELVKLLELDAGSLTITSLLLVAFRFERRLRISSSSTECTCLSAPHEASSEKLPESPCGWWW